jgi:hypothetical protein
MSASQLLHRAFMRPGCRAGAAFMPGLRAALIAAGLAELVGPVIAAVVIRKDSLHAKK